jgi:hypothetical protein
MNTSGKVLKQPEYKGKAPHSGLSFLVEARGVEPLTYAVF